MSGRIPRRVLISKVQRNSPANNVLMLGGTAGFIGRSSRLYNTINSRAKISREEQEEVEEFLNLLGKLIDGYIAGASGSLINMDVAEEEVILTFKTNNNGDYEIILDGSFELPDLYRIEFKGGTDITTGEEFNSDFILSAVGSKEETPNGVLNVTPLSHIQSKLLIQDKQQDKQQPNQNKTNQQLLADSKKNVKDAFGLNQESDIQKDFIGNNDTNLHKKSLKLLNTVAVLSANTTKTKENVFDDIVTQITGDKTKFKDDFENPLTLVDNLLLSVDDVGGLKRGIKSIFKKVYKDIEESTGNATTIANNVHTRNKNVKDNAKKYNTNETIVQNLDRQFPDGYSFEIDSDNDVNLQGAIEITGYATLNFENSNIESVTIPSNVKIIPSSMFDSSLKLKEVIFNENSELTTIGNSAFSGCEALTSITIPENVTTIGERAFKDCTKLTQATLPNNNNFKIINSNVFQNCSALTSITIPNNVETIGQGAFINCGLTSITIPDSVTTIDSNAFQNCGLTSITIPDSVTTIGDSAFLGNNFTSVTLDYTDWQTHTQRIFGFDNTSSIFNFTNIPPPSNVFRLTQTDVNDFIINSTSINTETATEVVVDKGVTSLPNNIFKNNTSIMQVTFEESSIVTTIGDSAFYGCTALTNITIPTNVTTIGGSAFYGCAALTSITIPDSVKTIGSSVFSHCTKLTQVILPNNSEFTNIGLDAFFNCNSLTSITIPDSVTNIGPTAFSSCIALETVNLPTNDLFKTIEDSTFSYCGLTSITIPDSVITISSSAFNNCALTSITIPDTVTNIGDNAFANNNFTSVTLDYTTWQNETQRIFGFANTSSIFNFTNIPPPPSNVFRLTKTASESTNGNPIYTGTATEVFVERDVTSLPVNIFKDNTIITTVTFQADSQLTTIGDRVFRRCTALTSITIPDSVTTIGEGAFYKCTALENVNLPTNEQFTTIGGYGFYNCSALTSITIPNSVKDITGNAFQNCTALENVNLPTNEQFTTIGGYGFYNCSALTSITIPNSVKDINYSAFQNCGLTSITIPDTVTNIGNNAFVNNNFTTANSVKLHYNLKPQIQSAFGINPDDANVNNIFDYLGISLNWNNITEATIIDIGGDASYNSYKDIMEHTAIKWNKVITDVSSVNKTNHNNINNDYALKIDINYENYESNNTLGSASINTYYSGSNTYGTIIPKTGKFDINKTRLQSMSTDIYSETNKSNLYYVTLHEIGHILGLGVLLKTPNTNPPFINVTDENNPDISYNFFTGTNAVREYKKYYTSPETIIGVPIENEGGAGTANYHWEEGLLGSVSTGDIIVNSNKLIVTVNNGKFYINRSEQHSVSLYNGRTYTFDQSDSTNANHPLRFSTTQDGTNVNGGIEYTTKVTYTGTPGEPGAKTEIIVDVNTPSQLYYYCGTPGHLGMGGSANKSTNASRNSTHHGLKNELMTGWLNHSSTYNSIPMSRITIGALEDLGYTVNYDEAEPFTLNTIPVSYPTTLTGHTNYVWCVALDAGVIVSGSYDNIIKVWDRTDNYNLIKTLTGHTSAVTSVALDAGVIVSGSYDNTIKVWDRTDNYNLIKTLTGHANYVTSVALDAGVVVSGSRDNTIKVWDRTNNYNLIKTLTGHTHYVYSVALDAGVIVSGSRDDTIKVWDRTNNYNLIKTLTGHTNDVMSVALDAGVVVSGSWDDTIKVWDRTDNYNIIKTLTGHTNDVMSVALDAGVIVSGSYDKTIKVWDREYYNV